MAEFGADGIPFIAEFAHDIGAGAAHIVSGEGFLRKGVGGECGCHAAFDQFGDIAGVDACGRAIVWDVIPFQDGTEQRLIGGDAA